MRRLIKLVVNAGMVEITNLVNKKPALASKHFVALIFFSSLNARCQRLCRHDALQINDKEGWRKRIILVTSLVELALDLSLLGLLLIARARSVSLAFVQPARIGGGATTSGARQVKTKEKARNRLYLNRLCMP